ncbi:uncharacterized protein LOC107218271 [Neodiprion lecontei]|uniref:Uncharacterized protein LOC107218271 n=1 Tax=Neodiprion lecontei TaxID=441921 RepID=A0A6J0BBN1_NEOLC|nr:uncharacterized protein LOC107218271 [Neodiprion lecontei]
MKFHVVLLLLLCAQSCLAQYWSEVRRYAANFDGLNNGDQTEKGESILSRRLRSTVSYEDSEDAEVVYDENERPRDKRTLGFIVRGLANALGYTLTPVQVASLPNPSPSSQTPPAPPAVPVAPAKPAAAPAAPPQPAAPAGPSRPKSVPRSLPPQPTQRETIRLTGVVNFGANANNNLPGQLVQYEQLFHGNSAAGAPASAPAPAPAPAPKPTLAKIPSPIVPNLIPLLPPTRTPSTTSGTLPAKPPNLIKQEVETEYRNKQDVVTFNVENKDLKSDKDVYFALPDNGHMPEVNWQKGLDERLQQLEERQKAYSDKLKEHEELLAKQQQDHEHTDERFTNREKEITARDETHIDGPRELERVNVDRDDEVKLEINAEDPKERYENFSHGQEKPSNAEDEEEHPQRYEFEDERSPKQHFEYDEEPKRQEEYEDFPPRHSSYNNEEEQSLPISRHDGTSKSESLQNSYGESLEDQGQIDENIADYFVKFKDPNTGLYIPEKTQDSENYKTESKPWWERNHDERNREDFDDHLAQLKEEYSSPAPELKYEEYELEDRPEESTQSAEKLENANDQDESTPQRNEGSKSPDYSESYGPYEPYMKNQEPDYDLESSTQASDVDQSPKSELKQDSDGESEDKSEKSKDESSTEKKDIPLYHFDFKSFMPYYSPVTYVYGHNDGMTGLERIMSYNYNSKPKEAEESEKESPVEKKNPNEDEQASIGLPQKLTMKSLHDGESKDIQAWPAPFDFVFDSTEQTNVAELPLVESTPETDIPVESASPNAGSSEGEQTKPVQYFVPGYDSASKTMRGKYQQKNEQEPYKEYSSEPRNAENEYPRLSSGQESDTTQEPHTPYFPSARYDSQESRAQASHDTTRSRDNIQEQRTDQPSEVENHRYTSDEYPYANHQSNYESRGPNANSQHVQVPSIPSSPSSPRQYEPRESYQRQATNEGVHIPGNKDGSQFGKKIYDQPGREPIFSQHYTLAKPRLNGRRFDESTNEQHQAPVQIHSMPHVEDKSTLRFDDPKSAHDFFGFSQNDYDYENGKGSEKSQELKEMNPPAANEEVLDLLVVPEPAPYHYDEKLTEFTDQPESDTEKVKVKEYRNKVATVTVSERKQLSPEGPVHLIGYTQQY